MFKQNEDITLTKYEESPPKKTNWVEVEQKIDRMLRRHTEPRTDSLIPFLKRFKRDLNQVDELQEAADSLRCDNKNVFHEKRRNFIWYNKDKYPHDKLAKAMGMKKGNLEKIILSMEAKNEINNSDYPSIDFTPNKM